MPIPDYQACFRPILDVLSTQGQLKRVDLLAAVSEKFQLTEQERRELLPSGKEAIMQNRVGWAKTYLKKAGLVDNPKKGLVVITEEGKRVLLSGPERLNVRYLKDHYQQFRDFCETSKSETNRESNSTTDSDETLTPEEQVEQSHKTLRHALIADILERLQSSSPKRFERLVVEVMVAMGYGGTLKDAGQAIGGSGDEGVDGVIKEDRLGLDLIYLQAKRWKEGNTVGRPELQKFVGALDGKRAHKGVFITTSSFSAEAEAYAASASRRLILIDGRHLAELMIDHDVGVSTIATYCVKRGDSDFFNEE